METILKNRDKKKSFAQKVSLHTLQRHLQLLELEEFLLLLSFTTAGILGRILLQGVPSVEPITFFTLLAGSLLGWKRGAIAGASAWYLSNFFIFGGQGPWTITQIAGGAFSGILGGILLQKISYARAVGAALLATVGFEIITNIASGIYFGFGIIASFLTAIPFTITHIVSNISFSLFLPKAKRVVAQKGKLDEKELCQEYLKRIKEGGEKDNDS